MLVLEYPCPAVFPYLANLLQSMKTLIAAGKHGSGEIQ